MCWDYLTLFIDSMMGFFSKSCEDHAIYQIPCPALLGLFYFCAHGSVFHKTEQNSGRNFCRLNGTPKTSNDCNFPVRIIEIVKMKNKHLIVLNDRVLHIKTIKDNLEELT
jgi:hypothetical protein